PAIDRGLRRETAGVAATGADGSEAYPARHGHTRWPSGLVHAPRFCGTPGMLDLRRSVDGPRRSRTACDSVSTLGLAGCVCQTLSPVAEFVAGLFRDTGPATAHRARAP